MRVFLTGATGFIGSHVMSLLLRRGHQVVVLSRKGRDAPHVGGLDAPGATVVTGDLLAPESFTRPLRDCDAVVHIAGWISTREADWDRLVAANVTATDHLWRACMGPKRLRIVYLASIFAHGWGDGDRPCDEAAAYDPAIGELGVPYFRAKRMAEELTWRFVNDGSLDVVFGYPGYCIGPGDSYLSSMQVVHRFLHGKLPGYVDGGMNFIDVRDAAAGLVACLDKGQPGQKYLLGAHNLRWSAFFEELAAVTGKSPPRLRLPYRTARWGAGLLERVVPRLPAGSGDIAVMGNTWFYDSSRARKELGLSSRPLRDSLRDGVVWLRTHQDELRR